MAAPAAAPEERQRLSRPGPARPVWRRRLAAALTGLVLATLVVLAVTKIDLAEVGHALARVNGWCVAVAVLLMAAAFLARAESWYAAIHAALPEGRVGRAAVTRALLIGMVGSAVAPGRLGEAARAWLVARRAGRVRDVLATVVGTLLSQTLLNVVALVGLSGIALAGSAIRGTRAEPVILTALVPAAVALLLVAAPALLARRRSPTGRTGRVWRWVRAQVVDVRRGLTVFRRPGPALHSTAFQLTAWALQCGCCYAVLAAFDLNDSAGLPAAAAVLVAVNITAIVPVTPSNVGVFQAACIAVLAPFHVPAGAALAYGLVLQAVEIGCALAMGLPSLLIEGVSIGELRAYADRQAARAVSGTAQRGY